MLLPTSSEALAAHAWRLVESGEGRGPFCSPRDGCALRRVPEPVRLSAAQATAALRRALDQRAELRMEMAARLTSATRRQPAGAPLSGPPAALLAAAGASPMPSVAAGRPVPPQRRRLASPPLPSRFAPAAAATASAAAHRLHEAAGAPVTCSRPAEAAVGPAAVDGDGAAVLPLRSVPRRALLAWLRGWAYLQQHLDGGGGGAAATAAEGRGSGGGSSGCSTATGAGGGVGVSHGSLLAAQQALKDARAAVAHSADMPMSIAAPAAAGSSHQAGSHGGGGGGMSSSGGGGGGWPSAHLLLAAAQAAAGEAPEAVALSWLRARGLLAAPAAAAAAPPRLAARPAATCALPHPATGVDMGHKTQQQEEAEQEEQAEEASAGTTAAVHLLAAQREAAAHGLEAAVAVLPEDAWEAVRDGGEKGLLALLARRAEERLPEFLRPRPRWHYYNAWMRQRILAVLDAADGAAAAAAAPATAAAPAAADLPPPLSPPPGVQEDGGVAGGWGGCGGQLAWRAAVVDKLLAATDANDLDLMLQHPVLLLAQAEEYRRVLLLQGGAALAAHTPQPLAWEEMQQAAGGGLEGLPIGYQASSASAAGGPAGPAGSASPASRFAAAAAALSAMQRLPLPAGLAGKPLAVAAPEPVLLLEAAEGGGALETGAAGFVGDRSGVMDDCALLLAPSTPRPAASQGAQGRRMLLGAMLRNGGEETGCFGSSQLLDSAALSSADVPPPPLAAEAPDSGPVPQAAHTSSAAPYSLFELD
ncbi:hypothetical protein CHLRE_08g382050v5 [Chlamydomonas reinhardtii]|uniref:Uncharacterized protein n=1 Tax=Chlamydomonas reinhardtii TaxID=3055 RepID=A0A2K3DI42_CHLRE|nr:uncharacterized protein CHLRE_08g382050v5 [Chlamydomonas reinhardtii]PNW80196.1 hypothetical protein CHLRE_08g382050v5 [Chlamydomonas reinhardtii]